jgi:hypothetical protein
MKRCLSLLLLLLTATPFALPLALKAQKPKRRQDMSGYEQADRATVLHIANLYVMADATTPPVATITPGHEIVVQTRNGPWVNVLANTDTEEDPDPDSQPEFTDPAQHPAPSTGWIRDKGLVGPQTPNGDAILFGAAADLEAQASAPHAPTGAAMAAHLLYRRIGDYFPSSSLAGEAAFRSADIRWQLDKLDIATLPSAKEQAAYLRPHLYEGELKAVMKNFAGTEWDARAAFDLIDNKLCGDWQGLPKCPAMESDLFTRYAERYKGGPKSAEALYDAAYRQGAMVTLYMVDEQKKPADAAAKNCQAIADQLSHLYPNTDWAARAQTVAFKVRQGIAVYGNDRE